MDDDQTKVNPQAAPMPEEEEASNPEENQGEATLPETAPEAPAEGDTLEA